MNDRPRVLLIARHYWPHGSVDSACFAYQMAGALKRDGVEIEVLTPRYASSWPDRLWVGEIPVHRPAAAPRSDWSIGRYTRHLTNWLRQHGKPFDVLWVDGIRDEATAAVEAARTLGCATVLRCAGWGLNDDTQWWQTNRTAGRCAAFGKLADAVVAKSAQSARSLLASGFSPNQVVRIDQGIAAGSAVTAALRHRARKSLAAANGDLFAEDDAPVILCTSPMTRQSGIHVLVEAARTLVMRQPNLRIWFIGDGPYRDWIYQQLRGDGVRASIAMPGSFCDSDDLFLAADLYLQPDEEGLDYFLPAAVRAGLPIVAVDNASTRTVLTGTARQGPQFEGHDVGQWIHWISGATPKLARQGLCQVLDDLPAARKDAAQLRRFLLRQQPLSATVAAYHDLFSRVIRGRSGRNLSVEAAS